MYLSLQWQWLRKPCPAWLPVNFLTDPFTANQITSTCSFSVTSSHHEMQTIILCFRHWLSAAPFGFCILCDWHKESYSLASTHQCCVRGPGRWDKSRLWQRWVSHIMSSYCCRLELRDFINTGTQHNLFMTAYGIQPNTNTLFSNRLTSLKHKGIVLMQQFLDIQNLKHSELLIFLLISLLMQSNPSALRHTWILTQVSC